MACDYGPYSVVLPKHYPTLHVIGRHKTTDLDVRETQGETTTVRRIEYIGMTAEVLLSSRQPNSYKLLSLRVNSRRWNIGPMSVGQHLTRSVNDSALDTASKDGELAIAGPRDSVSVLLRSGKIERVSYSCPQAGAK